MVSAFTAKISTVTIHVLHGEPKWCVVVRVQVPFVGICDAVVRRTLGLIALVVIVVFVVAFL